MLSVYTKSLVVQGALRSQQSASLVGAQNTGHGHWLGDVESRQGTRVY
jgi:hypothetical protein